MVEAVVTFFLEKLSTFITEEANLLLGVDEEVKLLQNDLEWMRLYIKNADTKPRANSEVELMVKQIRKITFQAEDVIDEFILKIHKHDGWRQNHNFDCWFTRSIKSCTSSTYQLSLLHKLGNQIKKINTMSEKISVNKSKYCIESGESSRSTGDNSSLTKLKRPPIAEEWEVVGIEDSAKQVKSLLMRSGGGDDDRQRRIVVSIVGMGGLGKTTLAKKLYNNADVKGHFDCFVWILVSQEYRLKDLLQGIIKCVKMHTKKEWEELEKLDEEETRKKLRDYLQGNLKYLIVLDDIWDSNAWDGLNSAFPDEMNGSRALLTTRNRDVAVYADSSSNNIHTLRFLNEGESWELFLKRIFAHALGGRRDNAQAKSMCPLELEQVGKEMIEKCGGLPLSIVVLGGLLSSKDKTHNEWSKINSNLNWQLIHGAGSKSCSEILALSYYYLPYYLKPCFLYTGLYPEDHEITASKLIRCWIAEGFVQRRGEETMEDVAEDYLEELIHRSLIQVGRWRYDGRVISCRVHDLLCDLAIAEAKEDQFFQVYARIDEFSAKSDNYVRRLSIHGFNPKDQRYFSNQFRYTRSLMSFQINLRGNKQFDRFISGRFKLLKVLNLESGYYYEGRRLPKAIGELIHLKYLSVLESTIIPNSIIKLVNLQTLYLPYCDVECIPSQFWMSLRQLRHLKLLRFDPTLLDKCCWSSIRSSCDLDNLIDLQTLCINSWDGINGGSLGKLKMLKKLKISSDVPPHNSCKKEILNSISKLTGLRSLELWLSENDEFAEIQISHLNYLTKLNLWGHLPSSYAEGNLFPPVLIKLTLGYSMIETEGMVYRDLARLPNLKFLLLYRDSYKEKKMVFPQGGFLRLQFLILYRLYEIEELIVEEGALISLTHLEINECDKMKMLPDGLRPLEELKVIDMTQEFIDRLSENEGEDWEKIKHIPSLIIKKRDFTEEEYPNCSLTL